MMKRCFKFSDGLRSLKLLSYQDKAVSSNPAFIKDKSSMYKFSRFIYGNNVRTQKAKKIEYLIDLRFTEKLRP